MKSLWCQIRIYLCYRIAMKKLALIILDGFGINTKTPAQNAIIQADSSIFKKLFSEPYSTLECCGRAVGLPEGQMGNSEVGHMTIGSGRVIKQNLVEIEDSVLHLLQLFGPGGVHAMDSHLEKILKLIPNDITVSLHLFGDGRDLAPDSAYELMKAFEQSLTKFPNVKISSFAWRYYGMDRDNNRDRIQKSYDEIVFSQLQTSDTPSEYIAKQYEQGITDEFIKPVSFVDGEQIESGDTVFHLNFRSDRARQMTQAIMVSIDKKNAEDIPNRNINWAMTKRLRDIYFVTMTKYYKEYEGNVFIKPMDIKNTLSETLSQRQKNSLTSRNSSMATNRSSEMVKKIS